MADGLTPAALGFDLVADRRDGTRRYVRRAHRYLVYWLVVGPDGSAELSWEMALGEYLQDKGISTTTQDDLSLFLYPRAETRGTLSEQWLREAMERAEQELESIRLADGT